MLQSLTSTAPAKVNFALSVGAPYGDGGMHPICSWMVTVDLHDELIVTRLDPGDLSRYAVLWHDDAPVPTDIDWSIRHDLAVRAHLAMEAAVGRALPVQLALRKRIPVGAGLGGGSSDAAAMLHACRALFDLHDELDDAAMHEIAGTLGSDVPFLLHGGSAIVEGFGETIEVLDELPSTHLVLILPAMQCSTGAIYRRFDEAPGAALRQDAVRALAAGTGTPFNDLAEAAMTEAAELGHLATAVATLVDRAVHVSGSGSTLFLMCDTNIEAQAMATTIARQFDVHTRVAVPTRCSIPVESKSP